MLAPKDVVTGMTIPMIASPYTTHTLNTLKTVMMVIIVLITGVMRVVMASNNIKHTLTQAQQAL